MSLADAFVSLGVDERSLQTDIRSAVQSAVDTAQREASGAGQSIGDALSKGLGNPFSGLSLSGSKTAGEVQTAFSDAGSKIGGIFSTVGDTLRGAFDGASTAVLGIADAIGSSLDTAIETATSLVQNGLTAGLTAAGIAAGALGTAVATQGVSYNILLQKTSAAFTTLLGTKAAAQGMVDTLTTFARSSPFPRQVFIQATQQLLGFGTAADKIVPTLNAIQDAVASTGGSSQDILSISNAFAEATAQGRITGRLVQELAFHGIQANQLIANATGKTTAQVQEQLRTGTLDATQGIAALVQGMETRFAGGANLIKQTMVGAIDRVKGATRDIGSALAAPFINPQGGGAAVAWANELADVLRNDILNRLLPALLPAMQKIADTITPIVDKFAAWGHSLNADAFKSFVSSLSKMGPLLVGVGAALTGALRQSIPFVGQFLPALDPVLSVLTALAVTSPQVRDAFKGLFQQLQPIITQLGAALTPVLGVLSDALGAIVPILTGLAGAFLNLLVPVLQPLADALRSVILPVLQALQAPLLAIVPNLGALATVFVQLFQAIANSGALTSITGILGQLVPVFGDISDAITKLTPLIQPIVGLLGAGISGLANALGGLLQGIGPAISPIAAAIGTLAGPLGTVVTVIASAATQLGPVFSTIAAVVGNTLGSLGPVLGTIASALGGVLEAAAPLIPVLAGAFLQVLRALAPLLPIIGQALSGLASALGSGLQAAVSGIATGLVTLANAVQPLIPVIGGALLQAVTALAPVLPQLGKALADIAISMAQMLVAIAPLIPPLAQFAAEIIDKIGAPALVAIADAIATMARGVADLGPLLPALVAGFVGLKVANEVSGGVNNLAFGIFNTAASVEKLGGGPIARLTGSFVNLKEATGLLFEQLGKSQAVTTAKAAFEGFRVVAGEVWATLLKLPGVEALVSAATKALGLAMDSLAVIGIAAAVIAIGVAFFEAYQHIGPFHDAVDAVGRFLRDTFGVAVGFVSDHLTAFKIALGALIALFAGPLLIPLGLAYVAFRNLSTIADVVRDVFGRVVDALQTMFAPIGDVISLFHDLATDPVKTLKELPGRILEIVTDIGKSFLTLPLLLAGLGEDLLRTIGPGLVSAGENIGGKLLDGLKALPGLLREVALRMIQGMVLSFILLPALAVKALITFGPAVFKAIVGGLEDVVAAVPGIMEAIGQFIEDLPKRVLDALLTFGASTGRVIEQGLDIMLSATGTAITALVGFFEGLPPRIGKAALGAFDSVVHFVTDLPSRIADASSGVVSAGFDVMVAIGKGIQNGIAALPGVALDIVTGLWHGLQDAVPTILHGIGDFFFEAIVSPIKAVLGISSPSSVFIGLAGDIITGLFNGLVSGIGKVLGFFLTLPVRIITGLADLGTKFLPIGGHIVFGILAGLGDLELKVIGVLLDLPGKVLGGLVAAASWFLDTGAQIVKQVVFAVHDLEFELLHFLLDLPGKVLGGLVAVGSWFLNIGGAIVDAIINGVGPLGLRLIKFLLDLPGTVFTFLIGVTDWFFAIAFQIGTQIISGLAGMADRLVTFFKGLPGRITDIAKDLWDGFVSFGKALVDKIVEGIESAPNRIADAIKGLVGLGGGGTDPTDPLGIRHRILGFAAGGIITKPTVAVLGEQAKREVVLPLTDPARTLQLAQQSGLFDVLAQARGPQADTGGSSRPTTTVADFGPVRVEQQPIVQHFDVHSDTPHQTAIEIARLSRSSSGMKLVRNR